MKWCRRFGSKYTTSTCTQRARSGLVRARYLAINQVLLEAEEESGGVVAMRKSIRPEPPQRHPRRVGGRGATTPRRAAPPSLSFLTDSRGAAGGPGGVLRTPQLVAGVRPARRGTGRAAPAHPAVDGEEPGPVGRARAEGRGRRVARVAVRCCSGRHDVASEQDRPRPLHDVAEDGGALEPGQDSVVRALRPGAGPRRGDREHALEGGEHGGRAVGARG